MASNAEKAVEIFKSVVGKPETPGEASFVGSACDAWGNRW